MAKFSLPLCLLASTLFFCSPLTVLAQHSRTSVIAQKSNLSGVTIRKQDLPPGFDATSKDAQSCVADLQNTARGLNNFATVNSSFCYQQNTDLSLQMLAGGTWVINKDVSEQALSSILNEEKMYNSLEKQLEAVRKSFTGIPIKWNKPKKLSISNVGDTSTGLSLQGQIIGLPIKIDMAMFRRGRVFALVCYSYGMNATPVFTVADVARLLDKRIPK